MTRPTINRGHKWLIGVVIAGVITIAGIGFAGSYKAVWALADQEGFDWFARILPIGVDAGIVVLYAFELLLTWLRMPYPLLRQTAWFLTGATIVMNSASAWGRPLAMGMHAVVPVLFIIVVEAARHAVGRWANLTAGKQQMEGFTLARWILKPFGTFAMWRRKHIWGIHSAEETISLEKRRRILKRLLKKKYGRGWRRQASELAQLLLGLASFGEGDPRLYDEAFAELGVSLYPLEERHRILDTAHGRSSLPASEYATVPLSRPAVEKAAPREVRTAESADAAIELSKSELEVRQQPADRGADEPEFREGYPAVVEYSPGEAELRESGTAEGGAPETAAGFQSAPAAAQDDAGDSEPGPDSQDAGEADDLADVGDEKKRSRADVLYSYYTAYVTHWGNHPDMEQFVQWMFDRYGETGQEGGPLSVKSVKRYWAGLQKRYRDEYETPQHPDLLELAHA